MAHSYTQGTKEGKIPCPGQPGLDNKLKASLSYIRRPCLKIEGLGMLRSGIVFTQLAQSWGRSRRQTCCCCLIYFISICWLYILMVFGEVFQHMHITCNLAVY